ncbi:MAG: hypothetical protein ACRBBN_12180 [Methyloligellaceae bacterium]
MLNEDTIQNKIINVTLELAEKESWANISMAEIASAADIGLAGVRAHFLTKREILQAFAKAVDVTVLKIMEDEAGSEELNDIARDSLFDVIMTRLEVMAPYRLALSNILSDIKRGKGLDNISLKQLWGSNKWMLSAAGISTSGKKGILKTAGLSTIYMQVLPVWFEDEDPGLAKTMATLDKSLRKGEKTLQQIEKVTATGEKILCDLKGLFRKNKPKKEPEQPVKEKSSDESAGPEATQV